MIIDERCVMCESGAGEDVEHLLVTCGEFERDQLVLAEEVSRIVGSWRLVGRIWKSVHEG